MMTEIKSASLMNINKIQCTNSDDVKQYDCRHTNNRKNDLSFQRIGKQEKHAHIDKHQINAIANIKYIKYSYPVFGKMCTGPHRVFYPFYLFIRYQVNTFCNTGCNEIGKWPVNLSAG